MCYITLGGYYLKPSFSVSYFLFEFKLSILTLFPSRSLMVEFLTFQETVYTVQLVPHNIKTVFADFCSTKNIIKYRTISFSFSVYIISLSLPLSLSSLPFFYSISVSVSIFLYLSLSLLFLFSVLSISLIFPCSLYLIPEDPKKANVIIIKY